MKYAVKMKGADLPYACMSCAPGPCGFCRVGVPFYSDFSTATEDRRDLYATVDWLDDKIADDGLMACALDTVPRINAASIESGRWVLLLGHEVIAHASSLRALREGSKPWPEGAVAWRVESTYRLEPNESIEVQP